MSVSTRGNANDWSDLQFFTAVAQGGSIANAARLLGVNHSTVLRRVAGLETALGSRLFDRLPTGYALTAAGNALAEDLSGVSEQIDAAHRRLLGLDEEIRGTVKLASSDIIVEGLLMPLLAEFRQRHRAVSIQLHTSFGAAHLSRQEADIAVRSTDQPPGHLIARCVGELESVLCASRAYLDAGGATRSIAQHRWIAIDESLGFANVERWLQAHVPTQQVVARIDSVLGVADAVAGGLGVGIVPRPLMAARPELVQLAPPDPLLSEPVWVLVHADAQRMARVHLLSEFLHDRLVADPHLAHAGA